MNIKQRVRELLELKGPGTHYQIAHAELMEIARELGALPARPDEPLVAARISRANDSRDVKPADLCRVMAHDIETGALKADGVVLVFMDRPKDKAWDVGRYVANMSQDEELVALTLVKEQCIRRWLRLSA